MTDQTLEERRKAEHARYDVAYEHPDYRMKPWRQDILRCWLHARKRGSLYLDIGCGHAESVDIGRKLGLKAYGCEIVKAMCQRPDVDRMDGLHKLPYQNNSFDFSSCNDVLEHVLEEDVPAALSEIVRVTRKQALLGICRKPGPLHVTIKPEEWWCEHIARVSSSHRIVFRDLIPAYKEPYFWVVMECG